MTFSHKDEITKKVPLFEVLFIDFRVSNGTRTHDQRNHNPLL